MWNRCSYRDKMLVLLIILSFSCPTIRTTEVGCEYQSSTYPIDSEWSLAESCQTCKCLANQIVICRNRTCQMTKDCRSGEQLTIKAKSCCPTCAPIQRSCLYDGTAILHNTIFYPKSCHQCRCRDGQLFCDDVCRPTSSQNQCLFHNELYQVNAVWSPLSCVICQCTALSSNHSVSSMCYIRQCPPVLHCHSPLEFIPGQCCPVCPTTICRDLHGSIYQNGAVWTKNNNCTHCICTNGSIQCSEEVCPYVQCRSNEKSVRLPNSCCSTCTNRSMCRFLGHQGYQIYYEHDLWYTSACQYCTCRRHNRIQCKSIQCEHQFCLEHEIQEARSDSCCVSCRPAKQCNYNEHILKEGVYRPVDNCTLCTCTSEHQPECYSSCQSKGYSIIQLKASNLQRNHTITVTDSLATIIAHSKSGTILSSAETRSLLFQFSSSTTKKSNAAVLLGIRHNATGQISYRLILINFNSIRLANANTSIDRRLSDDLRLWTPATQSYLSRSTTLSSSSLMVVEEKKISDKVILIILIIVLSMTCVVLVFVILCLCHQRQQEKQRSVETLANRTVSLTRPASSLSMVEKFHAPDLTTKVTLLTHFHLTELDFGTDV